MRIGVTKTEDTLAEAKSRSEAGEDLNEWIGERLKQLQLDQGGSSYTISRIMYPEPGDPKPMPGALDAIGGMGNIRGVRNNNPGNIRQEPSDSYEWQGEIGIDADGFVVYDTAENGIRALRKNLDSYHDKHGLTTVRGIIDRWAPPVENDTESYVAAVSESMGVDPDEELMWDAHKSGLVRAIIEHENGGYPYAEGPDPETAMSNQSIIENLQQNHDKMQAIVQVLAERRDRLQPEDPGWWFHLGEAGARMLPPLAVGVLARSPVIGAAAFAPDVYGNVLQEGLEGGMNRDDAQHRALLQTVAEVGTEVIPMGFILKMAKPLRQKAIKTLVEASVAEGLQEAAVEQINYRIDQQLDGDIEGGVPGFEDKTWGDQLKDSGYAASLGAALGGGARVGIMAGQSMADRASRQQGQVDSSQGGAPVSEPAGGLQSQINKTVEEAEGRKKADHEARLADVMATTDPKEKLDAARDYLDEGSPLDVAIDEIKVDAPAFEVPEVKPPDIKPPEVAEPPKTDVDTAALDAEAEPTDGQKEAGNYKKGHVQIAGMDISIENAKGSERSGTSQNGESWTVTMPAHYGYIRKSKGADGEQVDVYIGDNPDAGTVYVVDQQDAESGAFDEHKAMLGFDSQEQALEAYEAGFSDGKGKDRMGAVTEMPVDEFKQWAREGDTTKPMALPEATAPAEIAPPVEAEKPALPAEPASDPQAALRERFNAGDIKDNRSLDKVAQEIYGDLAEGEDNLHRRKRAQEALESVIVGEARSIVDNTKQSPLYSPAVNKRRASVQRSQIENLYAKQPLLNVRTSTSMAGQAYSTPVPMAYQAIRLANATPDATTYEPTAGNGMLLIGTNTKVGHCQRVEPEPSGEP